MDSRARYFYFLTVDKHLLKIFNFAISQARRFGLVGENALLEEIVLTRLDFIY